MWIKGTLFFHPTKQSKVGVKLKRNIQENEEETTMKLTSYKNIDNLLA